MLQNLEPEVQPPVRSIVFLIDGVLALHTAVFARRIGGGVLDEMDIAVSLLVSRLVPAARLFAVFQRSLKRSIHCLKPFHAYRSQPIPICLNRARPLLSKGNACAIVMVV